MSTTLLVLVTLAYLFCGIDLAIRQQWGQSMIFSGYCFANIGLLISMK